MAVVAAIIGALATAAGVLLAVEARLDLTGRVRSWRRRRGRRPARTWSAFGVRSDAERPRFQTYEDVTVTGEHARGQLARYRRHGLRTSRR